MLRQALLFTAAEYAALSLLIAVELHSVSARLTDALLFPPMAIAGVLGGGWSARFAAASGGALPRVLLFTATAAVAVPYAAMVVFSSYALIDPLTWDPHLIRDVAFALFLLNAGKSAIQFAALSVRCDRLPGRWQGRGFAAAATAATLTWAIAAATVVLALPDRFRIPLVTTISLLAAAVAAFLVYACASIRPLLARRSP